MPQPQQLSVAMQERVIAYTRDALDRAKAQRQERSEDSDEERAFHLLHALVLECLSGAENDICAERLLELADDVLQRRDESALALVLRGHVNLVALVGR